MKFSELSNEALAKMRAIARPIMDKYVQGADPQAVKALFESIGKVRGSSAR